jgi:hypothetical protein
MVSSWYTLNCKQSVHCEAGPSDHSCFFIERSSLGPSVAPFACKFNELNPLNNALNNNSRHHEKTPQNRKRKTSRSWAKAPLSMPNREMMRWSKRGRGALVTTYTAAASRFSSIHSQKPSRAHSTTRCRTSQCSCPHHTANQPNPAPDLICTSNSSTTIKQQCDKGARLVNRIPNAPEPPTPCQQVASFV